MLPDAALALIADNLARLSLDPVLYLKVAGAVVGPLMRAHAKPNGAGNGERLKASPDETAGSD